MPPMRKRTSAAKKRATTRKAKPAKKKPSRPAATAIDVLALRRTLGKAQGRKQLSRSVLAKLVGASPGSVQNWETGSRAPNARFVSKLKALAKRAAAGKVKIPAVTRRAARAKARRLPRAVIVGQVAVTYANCISVDTDRQETRLRFGVRAPGETAARLVADVLVPRDLFDRLRTR